MSIQLSGDRLIKEQRFLDKEKRDEKVKKLRTKGWKVKIGQYLDTENGVDFYTYYFYRASKEIIPLEGKR